MTSARQEAAARLLIKHLRQFVRYRRAKQCFEVSNLSEEELQAIDNNLVNRFRTLVDDPIDNDSTNVPKVESDDPMPKSSNGIRATKDNTQVINL